MVLEPYTKLCFVNKKISITLKNTWIEKIKNRGLEHTNDGIFRHWTITEREMERTSLTCNMEEAQKREKKMSGMKCCCILYDCFT